MKFHKYAEMFDLIEGSEFDDLVADIKEHGQREPITLYKGDVLDGRNRFLACRKAGVKPKTRNFRGSDADALEFAFSVNFRRRNQTAPQRAISAAKYATLRKGDNQHTARAVPSQSKVAEMAGVSTDSIQRAQKVLDSGSKALNDAVRSGEVPLKKAASVVDLPKSEQLAAATKKPADDVPPEKWEPDADDEALEAQFEKDYGASIDKIMAADDKLAAAHAEIKRQAAEIASLKLSRDGFMNGRTEAIRLLKKVQSKNLRLEKELEGLRPSRAA